MKWVHLLTNKVEGTSAEESYCSYRPFFRSALETRDGVISYCLMGLFLEVTACLTGNYEVWSKQVQNSSPENVP